MTDRIKLAEKLEKRRREKLIAGCKKIDANLGDAVESAFRAGYSADQVHAMLAAGQAIRNGPDLASAAIKAGER